MIAFLTLSGASHAASDPTEGDPLQSLLWPALKREFVPGAKVVFDERVKVSGPQFADDPMNVPISFSTHGLADVDKVMVVVERNPIRKVLEAFPSAAMPGMSFRFKLEQASPVRVFARTKAGVWHVGSTWVESAGGGCTVPGATRADGSWPRTLGQVSGRVFEVSRAEVSRIKLRIMHPMDTGLVSGVPAFYLNKLQLATPQGQVMLRLNLFEPVSENPVFSFDFSEPNQKNWVLTGTDNNGNRVHAAIQ